MGKTTETTTVLIGIQADHTGLHHAPMATEATRAPEAQGDKTVTEKAFQDKNKGK